MKIKEHHALLATSLDASVKGLTGALTAGQLDQEKALNRLADLTTQACELAASAMKEQRREIRAAQRRMDGSFHEMSSAAIAEATRAGWIPAKVAQKELHRRASEVHAPPGFSDYAVVQRRKLAQVQKHEEAAKRP